MASVGEVCQGKKNEEIWIHIDKENLHRSSRYAKCSLIIFIKGMASNVQYTLKYDNGGSMGVKDIETYLTKESGIW